MKPRAALSLMLAFALFGLSITFWVLADSVPTYVAALLIGAGSLGWARSWFLEELRNA